ncbi:MAG TPA: BTAD domain-containing putative transcriptional regulator [Candidatus Xenobia bacterium]
MPRSRLLQRLKASEARLVLVLAPAGMGKTTLMYDYARSARHPVAWLSVHDTDTDARMMAAYLVEALARKYEGLASCRQLLSLAAPSPASAETLLISLVNDLAGVAGHKELILDDIHFVLQQPDIVEVLNFLVHHAPAGFRILATSRTSLPPQLRLATLRSKGAAVVLTSEDLRFTHAEVLELLRSRWPELANEETVALLLAQTEGWVTGIELVRQAWRASSPNDVMHALRTLQGSNGLVFDYLAEEVLSRLSPDLRRFLLQTSVLEAFDVDAAQAATGSPSAADMLARLDEGGLFLVHLDQERRVFRYHHLFSEFLRAVATRETPAAVLAEQHRTMGVWYEGQGDLRLALHHTIKAADWRQALHLLQTHGEDFLRQGHVALLLEWLEAVGNRLDLNYKLVMLRGQTREIRGDWTGATRDYELALDMARQASDPAGLSATLERLAVCCARYGQVERMSQYVEEALARCPADDLALRARICQWFGASLVTSGRDFERGYDLLREGHQLARTSHNPEAIASACSTYGFAYHFMQGNLAEAERILAEGIELSERLRRMYVVYHLIVNRAGAVAFLGDPVRALAMAETAGSVTKEFHGSFVHVIWEICMATACLDLRETARARRHLEGLSNHEIPFQMKSWYHRNWLLLCLLEGNLGQARATAEEMLDILRLEGHGLYAMECLWALALELRVSGKLDEARTHLQDMLALADKAKAKFWQAKAHSGLAGLADVVGDTRRLHQHLAAALSRSRENCYDSFWRVDMQGDTIALCLEAVHADVEADYARELLKRMEHRFTDAEALKQLSLERRVAACTVLAEMTTPGARDLLEQWSRERQQRIRKASIRALGTIGDGDLKVFALGSFRLQRGEEEISRRLYPTRKQLAILKFLLCYYERECLDDQLIDALWPKADPERARHGLQVGVQSLRDLLHPDRRKRSAGTVVTRTGAGYILNTEGNLWLDLRAFEQATRRATAARRSGDRVRAFSLWEEACSLYRGELLLEDPYEDWLQDRRVDVQEQYCTALQEVGDWYSEEGRHRDAIQRYERLLQLDPYAQRAYRGMVKCWLALGDRAQAQRSVEALLGTLGKEHVAATPDLRDLVREVSRPA